MKSQEYAIFFCLLFALLGYTIWFFTNGQKYGYFAVSVKKRGNYYFSNAFSCNKTCVFLVLIAILAAGGAIYRNTARHLGFIVQQPVKLDVPLSALSYELEDWNGEDVLLSESIQKAAKNDDYLNRTYKNKKTNEHVNVYVAFTARPRTMLGHKPTVCYPANGWVIDNIEKTNIISRSGLSIPCLLHRFHRSEPEAGDIVVLNFYIVNGELTNDESIFSGISWRTPNIHGDPARYVAQVQISSVSENSVRANARDIADVLISFFPAKAVKRKDVFQTKN
jgi:hypothetical protein